MNLTTDGQSAKRWFSGDLQNHEDFSVPVKEHCEICRRAGYDFICLQYKDMQDPKLIHDAAELTTDQFLVIPGAEQAFQSCRELWAHFGFMPFPVPMPDTITDYFDIKEGLAEADRRHPGCLKTIHHPADQRWEMQDFLINAKRRAEIIPFRLFSIFDCFKFRIYYHCPSIGIVVQPCV